MIGLLTETSAAIPGKEASFNLSDLSDCWFSMMGWEGRKNTGAWFKNQTSTNKSTIPFLPMLQAKFFRKLVEIKFNFQKLLDHIIFHFLRTLDLSR